LAGHVAESLEEKRDGARAKEKVKVKVIRREAKEAAERCGPSTSALRWAVNDEQLVDGLADGDCLSVSRSAASRLGAGRCRIVAIQQVPS
jgi:hypothetical protein